MNKDPAWPIVVCLLFAIVFAWLALSGLVTGEVHVASRNCDPCVFKLASDPGLYWRNVGAWLVFSAFSLGLCVLFALKKPK